MALQRLQHLQVVLHRCSNPFSSSIRLTSATVSVTPNVARFDEKVHVRVEGLPSKAKVTISAFTQQEWQRQPAVFVSCGHYITSRAGDVDVWKDASSGGTFTGVEPMGLFWSMKPSPDGPKNIRLVIKNVEQPLQYQLSVFKGHLTLQDIDLRAGVGHYKPLASVMIDRVVKQDNIKRIPVKVGSVRGTLFLPPGDGPFPGIIDMFGLAGGLMETRSALLASKGFASLALPFFKYDDLPDSFNDVTFDYFKEAAKWMASHPSVKPGGIGVIAISGGAAVGLMMAWKCPEIKAFVRINSPGFHGSPDLYNMGDLMIKYHTLDLEKCPDLGEGTVFRDGWSFDYRHVVPLWEKDVHLLVFVCTDDGQISPEVGNMPYHLYPENRRHLIEVVNYEGAGHLLEPPYTPLCRGCYNPFFGKILLWGGHPKEHAMAQEDSWQRIQDFFHKHIG